MAMAYSREVALAVVENQLIAVGGRLACHNGPGFTRLQSRHVVGAGDVSCRRGALVAEQGDTHQDHHLERKPNGNAQMTLFDPQGHPGDTGPLREAHARSTCAACAPTEPAGQAGHNLASAIP